MLNLKKQAILQKKSPHIDSYTWTTHAQPTDVCGTNVFSRKQWSFYDHS